MFNLSLTLLLAFICTLIVLRLFGSYGKQVTHWLNLPIWYVLVFETHISLFIKASFFYFIAHFVLWVILNGIKELRWVLLKKEA